MPLKAQSSFFIQNQHFQEPRVESIFAWILDLIQFVLFTAEVNFCKKSVKASFALCTILVNDPDLFPDSSALSQAFRAAGTGFEGDESHRTEGVMERS